MLCYEGKLSLYCFLGTSILIYVLSVPQVFFEFIPNIFGALLWGPLFYFALLNMILRFGLKGNDYQIAIRATFLGFVLAASGLIITYAPFRWKSFGIYGSFMALFHYSEFLIIAWSNPKSLSVDSFILNHSIQYAIAAVCSWIEFIIEVTFFPNIKEYLPIWIIGLVLCVIGEILRKLAIITASSSFNHLVQWVKSEDHVLITHGVYGLMRHPSYVGWFLWSIGTQIILFNPFCIIIYAVVSWKFFSSRIFLEEITLINFFGQEYYNYQQRVPTGLPFIMGYQIENPM